MFRQRTVLVTCAAQNAALASIRSLHAAGWRVTAVDHDPRARGLASRAADRKVIAPHAPAGKPEAYAAWVVDYLAKHRTDVLLPITDAAIFALLPQREKLETLTALPWPASDALRAAADKNATFALARQLGVATPALRTVARDEPPPADLVYPVVVKPRASLVDGKKIAVTYATDAAALTDVLNGLPPAAFPVMLQQRIVGPGEGYFGVWRHGEPVVEFAHRRLREMPPSGGVSTLRESIPLPDDLREPSRRLLAHWRWHGPAMVEFKRDAAGRPYLMEVNGRLWGSLQLAVDAGMNAPLASALVALGAGVPPMTIRPGVRTRWFFGDLDATLVRLLKTNKALQMPPGAPGRWRWLAGVIADCFRPSVRSDSFRRDDPRPFFVEGRAWLRKWAGLARKRLRRPNRVRMLAHMHSTISYDGEYSIEQLAALMRERGVHVCCLGEHSRFLTAAACARLVRECAAHSDADLLLVPGVEYDAEGGSHILGLGCAQIFPTARPQELRDAIRAAGGLPALAHPRPGELADRPEMQRAVDGVEVWNTMHDGDYVPNPDALDQHRRVQGKGIDLLPLHGNDFHFRDNLRAAHIEIELDGELTWPNVAAALRARRYRLTNRWLSFGPRACSRSTLTLVRLLHRAQIAASAVKHAWPDWRTPCCWDFLACRAGACCPAMTEPDGGVLCWRVVGTFSGVDRRGPCCNQLPDCRDCAYYRWRNEPAEGQPLRILHLIETSNPGGAETMMVNLAANLDRDRFTSHACLVKHGWLEQKLDEAKIPVTVLPLTGGTRWRFAWRLAQLARRRRYDVLHSHEFTMNAYVFAAGLLARKPTVATVHGNLEYVAAHWRRRWFYQLLTRFGGPMAAVSRETRRRLVEELGLPAKHMRVIANGVELPDGPHDAAEIRRWRRDFGLPEEGAIVAMVGRLQHVKGHDVMLAALPLLKAEGRAVKLAIVGQGERREALVAQMHRLGLDEDVIFVGYRENVGARLEAFDVIAAPSRYEGLSLAVIEAMAARRPVVATRVGGNPEAIEDGLSGLLVPPEDPAALAAACGRLLDDPAFAARLGAAARERVENEFSKARMVADYQRLYEEKAGRG